MAVFAVAGDLDPYTGPQLREELAKALDEGMRWLVLDVAKVDYIDSYGLGIIVGAAKGTVARDGNLAVVAPQPAVMRVFEISGTKELLNVVGTLEEARERLGQGTTAGGCCGCEDTPACAEASAPVIEGAEK